MKEGREVPLHLKCLLDNNSQTVIPIFSAWLTVRLTNPVPLVSAPRPPTLPCWNENEMYTNELLPPQHPAVVTTFVGKGDLPPVGSISCCLRTGSFETWVHAEKPRWRRDDGRDFAEEERRFFFSFFSRLRQTLKARVCLSGYSQMGHACAVWGRVTAAFRNHQRASTSSWLS